MIAAAKREPERRGWHIGKEVPAALIVTLFVQTVGIVWWAAGLTSEVRELSRRVTGVESKVETVASTVHGFAAPNAATLVRIDGIVGQIAELRAQVQRVERREK